MKTNFKHKCWYALILALLVTSQVWAQTTEAVNAFPSCGWWAEHLTEMIVSSLIGILIGGGGTYLYMLMRINNLKQQTNGDNSSASQASTNGDNSPAHAENNNSDNSITNGNNSGIVGNHNTVQNFSFPQIDSNIIQRLISKDITEKTDNNDFDSDKRQLTILFSFFSTNIMDNYFRDIMFIDSRIFTIYYCWNEGISAGSFIIYDEETNNVIMDFYKTFELLIIKSDSCYESVSGYQNRARFIGYIGDAFPNEKDRQNFHEITKLAIDLQPKYQTMLTLVKRKYKLDLLKLSANFESNKIE